MNKDQKIQRTLEGLTRKAIDNEKVIEFGWMAFKRTIPAVASQTQFDEMRNAFFAGAQHLFSSILSVLEPDKEPTPKDLERMNAIANELSTFLDQYKQDHLQ